MKPFLLTGFQPFLGETINPSQILVQSLAQEQSWSELILPVSYQRAFEVLEADLAGRSDLKFLLMLGQAGGRRKIGLEKLALNIEHAEAADEDGDRAQERNILSGAPGLLLNELPLNLWKAELVKKSLPVELSHSAGTFVCNSVYFKALNWLGQKSEANLRTPKETAQVNVNCLFVHVPHLPQQQKETFGGHEGIDLETQLRTVRAIMNLVESSFS